MGSVPGSMPRTSGSGRWTAPMPRSSRRCWTHSVARRVVIASSRSARAVSPPVAVRARACMSPVVARWPASVTRSRWRESRTTRRRAASRTSTVRTCPGSACRTAAVRTAGTPAASARASSREAWERQPGVPSGPPWRTTSTTRPSRGSRARQRSRRSRARARWPARTARPTSESGPSRTTQGAPPPVDPPRRAPPPVNPDSIEPLRSRRSPAPDDRAPPSRSSAPSSRSHGRGGPGW